MNATQKIPEPDRHDYECSAGIARWWVKDGAWHIAISEPGRVGFFWQAHGYDTRDEAIAAIAKATA